MSEEKKEQKNKLPKLTKDEAARVLPMADYFAMGLGCGCKPDQLENFAKAGMILQRKQLEMSAAARRCDNDGEATMVGVGGARGGGKSQWMSAQICLDDCQRYPGLKFLLLRKSATALREQIRDLLIKTCRNVPYNYREQAGIVEFANGSFIIIKHFKDEKDIDDFLGQEYDGMGIEELTTLTQSKVTNLRTCLRTSKPGWRPRMYASWNWGGIGHVWVKRMFYDPWMDGSQSDTIYIKATVADNNHVNIENKKILEGLTGWKYKSWYLGDPNFQAGQFFTTWDERHHLVEHYDENKIVRWMGGFDYGWTHPTVFMLAGQDREGNTVFLDEYGDKQTTIDEHSAGIYALLRKHHLNPCDLDYIAAGRDCFSSKEDGTTISDTYNANGIELVPAEVDRINGWGKMLDALGDPEKGIKPTMFVHARCKNLASQIPLAQHHEKRVEDIEKMNASADGDGTDGDDFIEAARNILSSNPNQALKWAGAMPLTNFKSLMIEAGD
jgi:phage terminase large subunit